MANEAVVPEIQGIYFDTNVLLRGQQWPVPAIVLNNLLRLSALCGISRYLPEPVLEEAEEHWLRGAKEGIINLGTAQKNLQRHTNPLECAIKVEHPSVGSLLEGYRTKVDIAIKNYGISRIPFSKRTLKEVFSFATKYLLPFAPKAEGRGFQDAVILLSILDHLNSSPTQHAIFITGDNDFAGVDTELLIPEFDSTRLQVVTLDKAFDILSKHYYEESIIKPFEQEKTNAFQAVESLNRGLADFVRSRLTLEMAQPPVGRITKVLSVGPVLPIFVETPLPEPSTPDRRVEILIKVVAALKVVMLGGIRLANRLELVRQFLTRETPDILPPTEEQETISYWRGGIRATADVVHREFTNIKFLNLVPREVSLEETDSSLRDRGSAEFWMKNRIEEQIIEKTKLPAQTEPPQHTEKER